MTPISNQQATEENQFSQSELGKFLNSPSTTYCLNPLCTSPFNRIESKICFSCGSLLRLKERYRPLRYLDSGGMSRAFLAVDEDTPSKQQCVIKQFFPTSNIVDNPSSFKKAKELFDREAVQLERLVMRTSRVPKLFAYVEQDRRFYLVQEFIEGDNLGKDLEKNGTYSEDRVREFLNDFLPILGMIHEANVVHRDLKPENIMRRPNGEYVPIDFGMSKQLTSTISGRGTTGGTMGYAPPEQVRAGLAYPASDLYAVGATVIHLLTNCPPDSLYDFTRKQWVWREKMAQDNLPPVGRQLREVIDRLLMPDLTDRYPTVAEVLADLNSDTLPSTAKNVKLWGKIAFWFFWIATILGLAGWNYREDIECKLNGHNKTCPLPEKPKIVNGVLYYPYEPGKDRNGKSAEFNLAILQTGYLWSPGQEVWVEDESKPVGTAERNVNLSNLKPILESKGITKIMDNPSRIISVGMASCEGSKEVEEPRGLARAINIHRFVTVNTFRVQEYFALNLGQYRHDDCATNSAASRQRSVILMGIRKETEGVILEEALRARMAKLKNLPENSFDISQFSLGSRDGFQLISGELLEKLIIRQVQVDKEKEKLPLIRDNNP
jgi:serine/threonine protein kinase